MTTVTLNICSFCNLFQFMDAPIRTCWHAVTGAVRSTSFLSAFVGIFQVASFSHTLDFI